MLNKIKSRQKDFERTLSKTILMQMNKLADRNKTITKLQSINNVQSQKIDDLQTKILDIGKPRNCKDIKDLVPSSPSGVYKIEVDGETFEVRCEMNSASGGWTVFQRRFDGSVDFYRDWKSYEQGFGCINGEFWLGLRYLNKLTENSDCDLRVEFDGESTYAEYKNFRVARSEDNYKLTFKKGFLKKDGNGGDALEDSNNMEFSTYDSDHDRARFNCAVEYGGGFWWNGCGNQNINGHYSYRGNYEWWQFIWWDRYLYLRKTQLMIRPTAEN